MDVKRYQNDHQRICIIATQRCFAMVLIYVNLKECNTSMGMWMVMIMANNPSMQDVPSHFSLYVGVLHK